MYEVCVCVYTCMYLCMYVYVCMYVCVYMYVCMYECGCMYVCMCICIMSTHSPVDGVIYEQLWVYQRITLQQCSVPYTVVEIRWKLKYTQVTLH